VTARAIARVKRLLVFLRLVDDHDGLISLTNTLMLVAIAKVAFIKTFTLTELTALIVATAAYVWKGTGRRRAAVTEERIKAVEGAVKAVHSTATEVASTVASLTHKTVALENRVKGTRV
jgi:hypothetical protein